MEGSKLVRTVPEAAALVWVQPRSATLAGYYTLEPVLATFVLHRLASAS